MTDREKKSSKSSLLLLPFNNAYRLIRLVFLMQHDILSRCNECRFKCKMMKNWRGMQWQLLAGAGGRSATMPGATVAKLVNGVCLAMRIPIASEFDVAFMKLIEEFYDKDDVVKGVNAMLLSALMHARDVAHLKPVQLITKIDENILTTEALVRVIANITPTTREVV